MLLTILRSSEINKKSTMPFNTKISVTDEYSTQFPSHCDVFTEYSRLGKKSRKELENKRPQDLDTLMESLPRSI